jgi:hypothetical protein
MYTNCHKLLKNLLTAQFTTSFDIGTDKKVKEFTLIFAYTTQKKKFYESGSRLELKVFQMSFSFRANHVLWFKIHLQSPVGAINLSTTSSI